MVHYPVKLARMDTHILSFDVGTSGVKASLLDSSLAVIAASSEPYSYYSAHPGWAQIDPYIFIDAVAGSIRRLKENRNTQSLGVQKMVFCTQWKGLIAVNEDGHVLYDAILWLDKRAEEQASRLNAAIGREALSSADCIAKIVWLRDNHPDIYSDTYTFLEINAFLKWFATGVMVIDETSHYAKSFSNETQATLDRILKVADIPESKIPKIVRSDEQVGTLTHRAAVAWGLDSGIEVFGGLTDIAAIALGSSAAKSSQSHLYFGSSGWLGTVVDIDEAPNCPRVAQFIGNSIIRLDGLEAVGLARAWVLDLLFDEDQMGEEERDAWLEASLEEIDSSRSQLLSIPLIFKENPPMPSDVFAVFWAMRASDTKVDVYHAVLEGVCFLMRVKLERLEEDTGLSQTCISVCGGGTQSKAWMQMLADSTGLTIRVVSQPLYAGAIGSVAHILGLSEVLTEHVTTNGTVYSPLEDKSQRFNEKYLTFKRIYTMVIEPRERHC